MNCPGGMLVYKAEPRSYKDLPLRVGELGLVHRHEKSGQLHGLMRVRCFTQDDAHIFMMPEQIRDEIKGVVALIDEVYQLFGFKYHVELSTRPEDSMGSDEDWELATEGLRGALNDLGLDLSLIHIYLEVSRSTVELAYEQLLSEGYIESAPYRGFFVAQIDELYQLKKEEKKSERKIEKKKVYQYDFTPNGVDLNSFPYNVWRKLSKDILMDDRTELFRTGDPQGEYGFRSAISNYLYQARGVDCTPDQVLIGAGSDYILMLLGMILGTEHMIAFEDPTYKQAYRVIHTLGYETVPVAMDRHGMKIQDLESTGADIAYVTPSHQYPTGIVMPIGRRMELLKWAYEKLSLIHIFNLYICCKSGHNRCPETIHARLYDQIRK